MQLRACLGLVVLGLSACAYVPDVLHVEVGGSTIDIKKTPVPAPVVEEPANEPAPAPEPSDDPVR